MDTHRYLAILEETNITSPIESTETYILWPSKPNSWLKFDIFS